MPNWSELHDELRAGAHPDDIRRRYLGELHALTGRNVILYYSGWLQKGSTQRLVEITDEDKNGFMTVVHPLSDRSQGLDLVLHTPGGEVAATESLVDYLRSIFGTDIRAIIPQLAMSAGTMIACASKEIIMGKQSSLGPIDPQYGGYPAHGIVEEFENAKAEIIENPATMPVWRTIIAKYPPAFIGECRKAIEWANEVARDWLATGMFAECVDTGTEAKIKMIVDTLSDHSLTKSHSRHLSALVCRGIGLNVLDMEDNQSLQDAVLSLHHACMLTFENTPAVKIIENHLGTAFIKAMSGAPFLGAPAYIEHPPPTQLE